MTFGGPLIYLLDVSLLMEEGLSIKTIFQIGLGARSLLTRATTIGLGNKKMSQM